MTEVYISGGEKHYRLRLPYGVDENEAVELIVDISVFFDGEMQDDREREKFKIAGPAKKRH